MSSVLVSNDETQTGKSCFVLLTAHLNPVHAADADATQQCRVESRRRCVRDSQTSWRKARQVWTNLPTAKSSCIVSAAWTHPSTVVTQYFLCCWAIEVDDKWRHNDVIVENVINIANGSTTSKLAVLTHKIRATSTPSYLSDHIRPRETTRQLRSSTIPLLHRPTTRTHFADRAFRCCAPSVWNSLDFETLHCSSLSGFKRRLKTLLFRQTFSSTTWTVRQRLWSHPTSWRYIN